MSIRKHNEYLDAEASDGDEISGYDSEVAADSRTAGLAKHSSKRRKLSESRSEDDSYSTGDDATSASPKWPQDISKVPSNALASPPKLPQTLSENPTKTAQSKNSAIDPKKQRSAKPGVIYLSRVPPFMKPTTVRSLLAPHGPITRLFLTPEPPTAYAARKHHGGNKKRSFIDGWVEFKHKRHAKICVDAINGQIVGGKKGGWYRDDVWNARYLQGFGWGDLMEGVRTEEREREERVRVGVAKEGKERGAFLRGVEMGRVEETRKRKREAREGKAEGKNKLVGEVHVGTGVMPESQREGSGQGKEKSFERRFRQNEVKSTKNKGPEQSDEVKRVLSKIF